MLWEWNVKSDLKNDLLEMEINKFKWILNGDGKFNKIQYVQ